MSITIDSTACGTDANSYCTLSEVDSYMEKIPHFYSTWDALSDDTKNQWLVHSTMAIDRLDFSGRRYTTTQALKFPRERTDYYTDAGDIPQRVKDAQCEMIIYLYNYVDRTTGQIKPTVIEQNIDGTFSVKFRDEKFSNNNIAAGGTIESIINLLSLWASSQNSAHLRRG